MNRLVQLIRESRAHYKFFHSPEVVGARRAAAARYAAGEAVRIAAETQAHYAAIRTGAAQIDFDLSIG